jgi:hypothetical protein
VVSGRAHSRYQRRLADLPVAGRLVELRLTVRRFFCLNTACGRRTFVEQIAGLTRRRARSSEPLRTTLTSIGLALAGRAGVRLATKVGIRTSRNSLLRLVRAVPDPAVGSVRVLGVDDFAVKPADRPAPGLEAQTVSLYARAATWQEMVVVSKQRASQLDRFKPYLSERIASGCLKASLLHREVVAQGFTGSYRIVSRFVEQHRARPDLGTVPKPLSTRQVTGWICRHPDNLTDRATNRLTRDP